MRLIAFLACLLCLFATSSRAAELQLALAADEDLAEALQNAALLNDVAPDPDSARRDIVAAAQADYKRLLAVLFEAGHFGPTISITLDGVEAAELPVVGSQDPVGVVRIEVQPGPRFLFGRADIAPLARDTEIPEGFAPGQPAGTDILRQTTSAAVSAWRARGHAKAELESQDIVADHSARQLNVALALAPGPRLSYGPVAIEGNERVLTRQIARIADLRQGDVFDPDEVEEAARRLQRTGAFRSVSVVEAERIGPDATLPLTVQVVERLPRRFGFGGEISTTEGLGLSAFWLHRNLTGYADSLRIEGEVEGIGGDTGGEDFTLSLAYNRPATFNPETDLFVAAEIESLDEPTFSVDRAALEVGARRIVSDEFQYEYGIGIEQSETRDAFGTRSFTTLSLPTEAEYDRRDDSLNPADGYYIEAGLKPFYEVNRGNTGLRFTADLRGYQGFGPERGTVAALRLQLGSVVGPDLDEIPSDDLFFSGGGGTVRGQDYQSLGVTLDSGRLVGGRSFAGLSAEIRQAVTAKIGVVGFVDTGLISADSDWSDPETHTGAGLGLRYDTGIGPIRVDVGVPVDDPEDEASGFEIYIGIGQAF